MCQGTARARRASGAIRDGRCSQEPKGSMPALGEGISNQARLPGSLRPPALPPGCRGGSGTARRLLHPNTEGTRLNCRWHLGMPCREPGARFPRPWRPHVGKPLSLSLSPKPSSPSWSPKPCRAGWMGLGNPCRAQRGGMGQAARRTRRRRQRPAPSLFYQLGITHRVPPSRSSAGPSADDGTGAL